MEVCWVVCNATFFARCHNTEHPIMHPFNLLHKPFQYKIRWMAFKTCGHQGTAPAQIFLHLFSTWHLYSVASLSIFLYSSCCDFDSCIVTCFSRFLALTTSPFFVVTPINVIVFHHYSWVMAMKSAGERLCNCFLFEWTHVVSRYI